MRHPIIFSAAMYSLTSLIEIGHQMCELQCIHLLAHDADFRQEGVSESAYSRLVLSYYLTSLAV